ncbi:MAG: helix-turn-helix domain-containing protein [Dissulfuribacterales bacterium]
MNPDPRLMSFGRYLKAIRTQQKIPIEAVADEIRISLRQLSLIEAEDHDRLPDEVYVKGILRAYAKCIGIDADDIIDRYLINRAFFYKSQKAEADLLNSGKKALYRLVISLGLLSIIIVLSIYMIYGYQTNQPYEPDSDKSKGSENIQAERETTAVPVSSSERKDEKLFLEIDAVEDTWLKVVIDGLESVEYSMHSRDHIELEASSRFNMLVGNAGGVKMRLNEKSVDICGKSGEVVNIELP